MSRSNRTSGCMNCRFYDPFDDGDNDGYCRRHAPRGTVVEEEEAPMVRAEWPVVRGSDWCGEWEC